MEQFNKENFEQALQQLEDARANLERVTGVNWSMSLEGHVGTRENSLTFRELVFLYGMKDRFSGSSHNAVPEHKGMSHWMNSTYIHHYIPAEQNFAHPKLTLDVKHQYQETIDEKRKKLLDELTLLDAPKVCEFCERDISHDRRLVQSKFCSAECEEDATEQE